MNSNVLKALQLIDAGFKAAAAAQIYVTNQNAAVAKQLEIVGAAIKEGRDLRDDELAAAKAWAMEQKQERDRLLAEDAEEARLKAEG